MVSAHDLDVGDEGHVVQSGGALAQQGGGHQLQRRVLGPGYGHIAGKGMVAPNDDDFLVHF